MARTGRPRIPTPLRALTGNRSRRPLNADEPAPEKKAPPCPDHIQGEERAEWQRVTQELLSMGVLSMPDRAALEGYCTSYALWREAKDELAKVNEDGRKPRFLKTTSGYVQPNPWLTMERQYQDDMRKFWQEFGMTAAARTRLKAEQAPQVDPFDAWRKSKKKA